jgi:hypothetical protein
VGLGRSIRVSAALLVAIGIVIGTGGCELADPYEQPVDAGGRASERAADASPDATSGSSRTVLERTALAAGNWTSKTVDEAYGRAADMAVGDARTKLERQADEVRAGAAQAPSELRSRATVEAVVERGVGDSRDAIVVTREGITSAEVPGEGYQYKVTLAAVERTERGWAISRWEPQP